MIRFPPRIRCIRYAHTGDPNTAALRGLEAFRWIRTVSRIARLFGTHGRVHIGAQISAPCPDELLFLLMPATAPLADYIEGCQRLPGRSTVIDVHADVLRLLPSPPPSEMVVSRDDRGDIDAWAWWSEPDRQDALRRGIIAADVVTTPWPQMMEPLRELNPHVVLLPDFYMSNSKPYFDGFKQVLKAAKSLTAR